MELTVRQKLAELEPELMTALRAMVALVVPYALAGRLAAPGLLLTALGAWLGILADPGGARRVRVQHLLAFTLLASALFWLGEGLRGHGGLAFLIIALVAVATSLLRALDSSLSGLATILVVVTAIAIELRGTRPPHEDALFFGAGVVWAALLSSALWPIRRHRPLERALAAAYGALATHAHGIAVALRSARTSGDEDEAWRAVTLLHPRQVRQAIEAARQIAVDERRRSIGESPRGARLRTLLGLAEGMFPLLVGIAQQHGVKAGTVRAHSPAHDLRLCAARFERARRALLAGAKAARRARPPSVDDRPAASAEQLIDRVLEGALLAVELSHALLGPARGKRAAASQRPRDPGYAPLEVPSRTLEDRLAALRAALSYRSTYLRHGLRVAGAAAVAMLLGRLVSREHAAWVTVTTVAILQPYPGASWRRAGERLVGTMLGAGVALAIVLVIHSQLAISLLLVPLAAAAMATRSRSYRLFTLFLTPVFVLLARHGAADWHVAVERLLDALVGGAVALMASLLVFPSWEVSRLPDALLAMLASLRDFAAATLDPAAQRRTLDLRRRKTALALGEAESSLERMLTEPGARPPEAVEAMQLVTGARRLFGSLTALTVLPDRASADERARAAGYVRAVLDEVERHVRAFASQAPPAAPTPPERPALTVPASSALGSVVRDAAILAASSVPPSDPA